MAERKKLSGAAYRKIKMKKEKEIGKFKGSFEKYLMPSSNVHSNLNLST